MSSKIESSEKAVLQQNADQSYLRSSTVRSSPNGGSASALDEWVLRRIYSFIGQPPIRIALQGGAEVGPQNGEPAASVIVADRRTLMQMLLSPELGFGDGYMQGRIRVEGDLTCLLELALRTMEGARPKTWYGEMFSRWLKSVQANTLRGSAKNIHHHYDLPADFYRLWLDARLAYTCAYFPSASMSLEQAQEAKMDYVCRKVQLQRGERVAEAGCGWGALALHMARRYGVKVKAFNISREQILFARGQAKAEGLDAQVEFIEDDYRNISGQYDAFVSVGMLEHLGAENYRVLGRVIHRAIGDGGRGLLHFIGRNQAHLFSPWIRKRIFPGAHVPTLREAMDILDPWNFSVLDIENLRPHYARTLEHWLARFENSVEVVTRMCGAEFVRAWRLYLAGSLAAFRIGRLQLFQVVFAGSQYARAPLTRASLYQNPAAAEDASWFAATS